MKRPWEVLAAGYVLGELAAGAGISVPAAAVMLTVCFALDHFGERAAGKDLTGKCRTGKDLTGKCRAAALLMTLSFFCGALRMGFALRPMPAAESSLSQTSGIAPMQRAGTAPMQTADTAADPAARTSFRTDAMERKNGQLVLTCGDTLLYVPEGMAVEEPPAGLQIGNRIEVSGKCSEFPGATNPGQFDSAAYYRAKGIRKRMYVKELRVTDARCAPVRQFLYRLRNFCISLLYQNCDADDAAFLSAVLFGDRSGLSEDFRDLYQKNGIAHLLAISGLHVSILGLGFYHSLRKSGRSFAVSGILSGTFLVLYGLLTGAGTSVTRAVLMLLLLFLAEWEGRTYDLRTAACIAAVVQLLVHPFELYQCGFQLSFLAVLAIGGPADTLIRDFGIRNSLLRSLIVSISVTLCTLPVIAYWFFAVPAAAPFLNLLVIPLMGWILGAGLLVLLLAVICFGMVGSTAGGMVSAAGGMDLGTGIMYFLLRTAEGVAHRLLQVNEFLCKVTERIPGTRILTGRPEWFQILGYVLLLGGSYAWILRVLHLRIIRKKAEQKAAEEEIVIRRTRPGAGRDSTDLKNVFLRWNEETGASRKCGAAAAIFLLAALLCLVPLRPRKPEIWFLDVGQGDGIAVLYRDSCVLIDGGSSSQKESGKKILEPFLNSKAVSRIETVFLTHADTDHINGIEYLLAAPDAPEIGRVVLNAAAETDPAYDELKKEIRAGGADLQYLGAGEEMGAFRCLWPERASGGLGTRTSAAGTSGAGTSDLNEQSLVLLFTYGENQVLLTGDAGIPSEAGILREYKSAESRKCTGLKMESAGSESTETESAETESAKTESAKTGCFEKRISILKAGHHGSSTSSGEEFLDALRPEYTVISCGRNNRYGHPHRETLNVLESVGTEIFSTAVCGAVRAELDGEGVKLHTFLDLPEKTRKY